jgi:glucans biosynthesis protein
MTESRACGARTRSSDRCESVPMHNGRCRIHGGMSPGAPKGNRNAWKHGLYSREIRAIRELEKWARPKTKRDQ